MMARIYGGEEWYVGGDRSRRRVECLYERDTGGEHTVQFIVAVRTGDDGWARRRVGRGGDGDRGGMGGGTGGSVDGGMGGGGETGRDGGRERGTEGEGRGGGECGARGTKRGRVDGEGGEEGREGRKQRTQGRGGNDRKRTREEDAAGGDRPERTCGVG